MVQIVRSNLFQEKIYKITDWYVQQGVSKQSIRNIISDIQKTIDIIENNPNGFRILKTRPLHYATTYKYKFNIYYTVIQNTIILADIKASKQDGLYETINDEINEILRIAGVKNII